jgi:cyclopropane fatty-acyl-phospholipid synthase-like methyltransferase
MTEDHHAQLQADMVALEAHYARLVASNARSPASAQWSDRETQEQRMVVLAEVGDLRGTKVLDFGCGTGQMLSVLRSRFAFDGTYVGYDLVEPALALGRAAYPDARFERRNILTDGVPEEFDYVFVSGVFNNAVTDNWAFLTQAVERLFARTRRAIAFNALSTYVDRFDEGLEYFDPARVLRFCKERLSPKVTLRHDYEVRPGVVPYEFTAYVYKTTIECRPNLARQR